MFCSLHTKRRHRLSRNVVSALFILFSFLFFIFFAITHSNNANANVDINGFSLQYTWYDSSINSGNTPTESIEWSPTSSSETRSYTQQVTFKSTADGESYDVGELKIIIPLIGFPSYNLQSVSAGELSDGYEWNYTQENGFLIFTNNVPYEIKANSESSLQIKYYLKAESNQKTFDESYIAEIYGHDSLLLPSNAITVSYHPKKSEYTLKKTASTISGYDGLGQDASSYIWVRWTVNFNCANGVVRSASGTYPTSNSTSQNIWMIEHVPDGSVVLDRFTNQIDVINGEAKIFLNPISTSTSTFGGTAKSEFFIGYPKSTYTNQTITNIIDEYVIYKYDEEATKTDTYQIDIELNNYDISLPGHSYIMRKESDSIGSRLSAYKQNHQLSQTTFSYRLHPTATYSGTPFDMQFGDDILVEEALDGTSRILSDEEYYFKYIDYRPPVNINGGNINSYPLDVYVRYRGDDEYTLLTTLDASQTYNTAHYDSNILTFSNKNVVAWKIIIKGLNESALFSGGNTSSYGRVCTAVTFTGTNFANGGKIFNYGRLQTNDSSNGTLLSNISIDTYNESAALHHLDELDIQKYGSLQARDFKSNTIIENEITYDYDNVSYNLSGKEGGAGNGGFMNTLMDDVPADEKFYGYFGIRGTLSIKDGSTNSFKGYNLYGLLPKGIYIEKVLKTSKTETSGNYTSNSGSLPTTNYQTASGANVTVDYIYDHTQITVIHNYKDTGRDFIAVKYDFRDDPLNFDSLPYNTQVVRFGYVSIKCSVSYDSYIENGSTYNFKPLLEPLTDEATAAGYTIKNGPNYTSKDTNDFNDNNDTNELFFVDWNSYTLSIVATIATRQDTSILVSPSNDDNDYSLTSVSIPENSQYNYKLRVRTGQNAITNLVSYINLEDAHEENPYWQGNFHDVDTSKATEKGYKVKIYYSTTVAPLNGENPERGTLTDPSFTWREYNENVDKSTIKSLAFEYLDLDNQPAIIPENSVIYSIAKMKIDNGFPSNIYAYCASFARWNAIDNLGNTVDQIVGTSSNVVTVNTLSYSMNLNVDNIIQGTDEQIQINKDKEFLFTISFEPPENSSLEQLVILLDDNESNLSLNNNGTLRFALKHGQKISFKYLPPGTHYKLTSSFIYKNVIQTNSGNIEGDLLEENTDVHYINQLTENSPSPLTGITTDVILFVNLIAISVIGITIITVFHRKH